MISDIHANLPALREVFKDIFEREIENIIVLGDIVGYGPYPLECIDTLLKAKKVKSLFVLKGNHDHYLCHGFDDPSEVIGEARVAIEWTSSILQEKDRTCKFLDALPDSLTLRVGPYTLYLVHGSPDQPLREYVTPNSISFASIVMFLQETGYDLCLVGHTHVPFFETVKDPLKTRYIGNPGSVGQPRDKNPKASYMVLNLTKEEISAEIIRVEYDIDMVKNKIRETGLPEMLAERLNFGI